MKRLTKEEKATLSPEILRDYLRWADPKCDSVIRVRALLEIHEVIDKFDGMEDTAANLARHGAFVSAVKRILGRK